MSDSTEDVLDLFPEDGDMFSATDSEKKATPKPKAKETPQHLVPAQTVIKPIEFYPSEFQAENKPDSFGNKFESHSNTQSGVCKLGGAVTVNKRKVTSRLGPAKQGRWNDFPYPKNENFKHGYNLITPSPPYLYSQSSPPPIPPYISNSFTHDSSPIPNEPEQRNFFKNEHFPFDNNMQRNVTHPFRPFPNEQVRFAPCNPNPYVPPRMVREKLSLGITQRDFDYLNDFVNEKNVLKAWDKFNEIITTSSLHIPLIILLEFISLFCQPDTFTNWNVNCAKPDHILTTLVNYLHRNNFKDTEVYDQIMFAFSHLPVNMDIFRCLEVLKARPYHPSRRTLLAILNAYAGTEFNTKLLDFFQVIVKHEYFDPETINTFFAAIHSKILLKRDQVIDMLSRLSIQQVNIPHESFARIVQSFIDSGDISNVLLVLSNASSMSEIENSQIETIIMKSTANIIPKVLNFVEKLDESQRSSINQSCYAELFEKSITFNYPYGVGFLFSQFINFNKLIDTGLITKILEFLFKYNHIFQISEIFDKLEAYMNSNQENSLTNIVLPPTMHKITQILVYHHDYKDLYAFVVSMLNEKIVPLKPVIKCLTQHLTEINEQSKLQTLFECANRNDLVFDAEIARNCQQSPASKPKISHYILETKTPTQEKEFKFTIPQEATKSLKTDILTSSIDNMVSTNIPPDHIFNHILVSLGQSNDASSSFKLLLDAFIPGDPDRPVDSRNILQQILIRTSMRLSTNFAFIQNWSECIRFLSVLNESNLFNVTLDNTYSKELFHFLISIIQSAINENEFKEVFLIFDKINWPQFTLFEQTDVTQYKTELFALYKHCIEQVDLHNAYRIITYLLQDKNDENAKSGFSQLLSITSNMGETSIALPLFNFMNTNKIDVSLDHLIYQKLITHLGQENKLQQAKTVFQHGVDNSCYTAMLSIMANPHQINLFSTLVPLEIKFILEKRLLSLYNMHKDSLTQLNSNYEIKPFEISFHRNTQTTNRTAFQESIRSFIIMLSEEFTPPLIENSSDYLKDINYLKYYRMQITAVRLRQYLLANFVAEKDQPMSDVCINDSGYTFTNGKNFSQPNTYKSQYINQPSPLKFAGVNIKTEPKDEINTLHPNPSPSANRLINSDWFSEVKRNINSKLSKFYWTGPITTKEDYNIIAKRIIKTFRENIKYSQLEMSGVVTTDQNTEIDSLIADEMSKLAKK